jgi:hypothetical protein
MMEDSIPGDASKPTRLPNPFLDFAVTGLAVQLKFWQAYQVEGAGWVAKRMRKNLEQLRTLGHCCDAKSLSECQLGWLREIQKDYAEELARITATTFTLGLGELPGLGWLFGKRTAGGQQPDGHARKSRPDLQVVA